MNPARSRGSWSWRWPSIWSCWDNSPCGSSRPGSGVGIAFGLAILAFPAAGAWVLWREMRFGYRMQQVAADWQQLGSIRRT